MSDAYVESLAGKTIRGYHLIELIGQGGFGAVYRAMQPLIGREVAVKIILPHFANHPEFIRRFEVEAQLIARLEHPFMVPLYDYWREPDGAYLVMRYLRGGSMRPLVKTGPLQAEFVDRALSQIATALAVAHRAGVVHRDLKPDNILMDEQGNAYLTDFGIAKDLESDQHITESDSLIGSFAYVSPEQAMAERVTAQSDLYSLGVVLYELLAGQHPFPGAAMGVMLNKHMHEALPPLQKLRPDLPNAIDEVLQKATAKKPDQRYRSVIELATAFRRAVRKGDVSIPLEDEKTFETPENSSLLSLSSVEISGVPVPLAVHTSTMSGIVTPEPQNPYRGLRAFQEGDADQFYGREAFIDGLLKRLNEAETRHSSEARFLAVVGPSGSGKSSVLRAGLIPALRDNALPGSKDWYYREMFPGAYPLEELEAALLRIAVNPPPSLLEQLKEDSRGLLRAVKRVLPENGQLFLLIDQFEELFTLCESEDARAHFVQIITEAITDPRSQIRVVITLRTDFYGHLLQYPAFSALLRNRTEVILPMSPEELRRAITAPAGSVGVGFEQGLVELILSEVKDQPGALPLVQYALTELFERREKRQLTIALYQASGGVFGALARRADELYAQFDAKGKQIARQLFLRLVTLGEGVEDTRRRVHLAELISIGDDQTLARSVIDGFGRYRLLTFDRDPTTREPTVEVAHEALIREWAQMREWLNASREDVRLQRRVAGAAAEWVKTGRDASFLASGVRLQQLEGFATGTDLALTQEERDYIQAGIAQREREQDKERARQQHEQRLEARARNRLRGLVAVFAGAFVIAAILSIFAFNQRQVAQDNAATATNALGQAQFEADRSRTQVSVAATSASIARIQQAAAERNAAEANSLRLSTDAQRALGANDPELALALALEANRIPDPPLQVRQILYRAAYAPGIQRILGNHTAPVRAVAYGAEGRVALSGSEDKTAILWDMRENRMIRALEGHTAAVLTVALSPDGKTALTGSGRPRLVAAEPIAGDNTLRLWDVETGKERLRLTGHTDAVTAAVFSPNGQLILSGSADQTVMVWDATTGAVIKSIRNDGNDAVLDVLFSSDGKSIYAATADRKILAFDLESGEKQREFTGHGAQVNTIALSPNGRLLLSGGGTTFSRAEDFSLILWDTTNGAEVRRLQGHTAPVTDVAFSRDGRTAISSSTDRTLILWDVRTGKEIRRFTGHSAGVQSVALDPERTAALSGGTDNRIIAWDLESSAEIWRRFGHTAAVTSVATSQDGTLVASASVDNVVILWDAATGQLVRRLSGHTQSVLSLAFSPDGRSLVSGSADRSLIVWDVGSGGQLARLRGHIDRVNTVAYSPDGKRIVSGSGEGNLILWNVGGGSEILRLLGHSGQVTSAAFTPDGRRVISGSADMSIIIWDAERGGIVQQLRNHTDRVLAVAISPDGRYFASGGQDSRLLLWDMEKGVEVRRFNTGGAAVTSLALSRNGREIAAAQSDGTIFVADIETPDPIYTLRGHSGAVASIRFSGDGKTILSGGSDASIIQWQHQTPEELIAWLRSGYYLRDLTCAERRQYQLELTEACGA
jgi:WD40 repeat protein/serine/threonine protein kinase